MKVSFVELRKKSSEIVRALDRNERITVFYRGRAKAILEPIAGNESCATRTAQHAAFGLWRDRNDYEDAAAHVRALREIRFCDL